MPDADWADARAAMLLDPAVANLNTGSFGPLSRAVFRRVTELRHRLAEEPMDFLVRAVPDLLWRARAALGEFLRVEPTRLLFTSNVSASINLVASSLQLASPGEVLLTDHEYGAMHWCWERAARRMGLTLRTFALPTRAEDPGEVVAAAEAAMTPRTRLFFFSHVLSPTGLVLPARELCELARRRGVLTVIDGAHAPVLVPLDLSAIPYDFYGANAHKWMLAPTGSGFLAVGPGNEDRLQPLHVSWGYHTAAKNLDERDEFGSTARLRRLEFEGTRDVCPWLCLPEAIDFQAALGYERIRARHRELVRHVRSRFADFADLRPATPENPASSGALMAYEVSGARGGGDPALLRKALWDARIEVPVIERPDRLLIRTSTHFYNTEAEVDRLANSLPGILAASGVGAGPALL
jgi:isopenicillin-N epimerase